MPKTIKKQPANQLLVLIILGIVGIFSFAMFYLAGNENLDNRSKAAVSVPPGPYSSSPPPGMNAPCTEGQKRCTNYVIEQCKKISAGSYTWESAGKTCNCPSLGKIECNSGSLKICAETPDPIIGWDWAPYDDGKTSCAPQKLCPTLGAKRCRGEGYIDECKSFTQVNRWEWVNVSRTATLSCTAGCTTSGERRCFGATIQECKTVTPLTILDWQDVQTINVNNANVSPKCGLGCSSNCVSIPSVAGTVACYCPGSVQNFTDECSPTTTAGRCTANKLEVCQNQPDYRIFNERRFIWRQNGYICDQPNSGCTLNCKCPQETPNSIYGFPVCRP